MHSSRFHLRGFPGKRSIQDQQAAVKSPSSSSNWGMARSLVVRVCVVASPMALCDTSRGRLVAAVVMGNGRPSVRGVCVMPLLSTWGVGGMSLGICCPSWMAVTGSGSALTMVWWITMRVFLSPPAAVNANIPWVMVNQVQHNARQRHAAGWERIQWHPHQIHSPRWYLDL